MIPPTIPHIKRIILSCVLVGALVLCALGELSLRSGLFAFACSGLYGTGEIALALLACWLAHAYEEGRWAKTLASLNDTLNEPFNLNNTRLAVIYIPLMVGSYLGMLLLELLLVVKANQFTAKPFQIQPLPFLGGTALVNFLWNKLQPGFSKETVAKLIELRELFRRSKSGASRP